MRGELFDGCFSRASGDRDCGNLEFLPVKFSQIPVSSERIRNNQKTRGFFEFGGNFVRIGHHKIPDFFFNRFFDKIVAIETFSDQCKKKVRFIQRPRIG